ncbi:putative dipeptidyl-peptidase, partial [Operophtera brumata]
YLQDTYSWLDANRTCIWGWSYGGYAASLALARGGDVFRCAAAVAPVVDWRFYDTIYTERYMDVPANNALGYAQSSLLTDDVSYFLIHGTADDNVHYQHAMLISRLLQRRDVYFTQMIHGTADDNVHYQHAMLISRLLQRRDVYFTQMSYFLIHGAADDNVHYQHAMLISRLLQRRDVYFTQMFLIHGAADDNVHYQHAMLISRLLQRRDVYFTQMSYTDEDHGLVGVRPHLYHGLEKFLQEHML